MSITYTGKQTSKHAAHILVGRLHACKKPKQSIKLKKKAKEKKENTHTSTTYTGRQTSRLVGRQPACLQKQPPPPKKNKKKNNSWSTAKITGRLSLGF